MSQSGYRDPFHPSNFPGSEHLGPAPEAKPESWEDGFGVGGYGEGGFDDLGDDAFYSDDAFWAQGDLQETITVEKIRELYQKVDLKDLPNEEELLATLKEAEAILSDGDSSNDDLALEHAEEVEYSLEDAEFEAGQVEEEEEEILATEEKEKEDLVPQSKFNEIAGKIRGGIIRIGAKWIPQGNTNRLVRVKQDGKIYSSDSQEENQDILDILPKIAEAIGQADPEKKAELWDSVGDDLVRLDTENEKKGNVNDRFRLLANVLYGELGEEGLKEALKLGVIPKDVANMIAQGLRMVPGEVSSKKDAERIWGGPDWTHATLADFFTKHAGLNSLSESE